MSCDYSHQQAAAGVAAAGVPGLQTLTIGAMPGAALPVNRCDKCGNFVSRDGHGHKPTCAAGAAQTPVAADRRPAGVQGTGRGKPRPAKRTAGKRGTAARGAPPVEQAVIVRADGKRTGGAQASDAAAEAEGLTAAQAVITNRRAQEALAQAGGGGGASVLDELAGWVTALGQSGDSDIADRARAFTEAYHEYATLAEARDGEDAEEVEDNPRLNEAYDLAGNGLGDLIDTAMAKAGAVKCPACGWWMNPADGCRNDHAPVHLTAAVGVPTSHNLRYDAYQIHPCVLLDADENPVPAGDPRGVEFARCKPDDPNLAGWTVYGHKHEGGLENIADFQTLAEAEDSARGLASVDAAAGTAASASEDSLTATLDNLQESLAGLSGDERVNTGVVRCATCGNFVTAGGQGHKPTCATLAGDGAQAPAEAATPRKVEQLRRKRREAENATLKRHGYRWRMKPDGDWGLVAPDGREVATEQALEAIERGQTPRAGSARPAPPQRMAASVGAAPVVRHAPGADGVVSALASVRQVEDTFQSAVAGEGQAYSVKDFATFEYREHRGEAIRIGDETYTIGAGSGDPRDWSSARHTYVVPPPVLGTVNVGRTCATAVDILKDAQIVEGKDHSIALYDADGKLLAVYNAKTRQAAAADGATEASPEQVAAVLAFYALHPRDRYHAALALDLARRRAGTGTLLAAADSAWIAMNESILPERESRPPLSLGHRLALDEIRGEIGDIPEQATPLDAATRARLTQFAARDAAREEAERSQRMSSRVVEIYKCGKCGHEFDPRAKGLRCPECGTEVAGVAAAPVAPLPVDWPTLDGKPMSPATVEKSITYARQEAARLRESASRRRSPAKRKADLKEAKRLEKLADGRQVVLDAWDRQTPIEAVVTGIKRPETAALLATAGTGGPSDDDYPPDEIPAYPVVGGEPMKPADVGATIYHSRRTAEELRASASERGSAGRSKADLKEARRLAKLADERQAVLDAWSQQAKATVSGNPRAFYLTTAREEHMARAGGNNDVAEHYQAAWAEWERENPEEARKIKQMAAPGVEANGATGTTGANFSDLDGDALQAALGSFSDDERAAQGITRCGACGNFITDDASRGHKPGCAALTGAQAAPPVVNPVLSEVEGVAAQMAAPAVSVAGVNAQQLGDAIAAALAENPIVAAVTTPPAAVNVEAVDAGALGSAVGQAIATALAANPIRGETPLDADALGSALGGAIAGALAANPIRGETPLDANALGQAMGEALAAHPVQLEPAALGRAIGDALAANPIRGETLDVNALGQALAAALAAAPIGARVESPAPAISIDTTAGSTNADAMKQMADALATSRPPVQQVFADAAERVVSDTPGGLAATQAPVATDALEQAMTRMAEAVERMAAGARPATDTAAETPPASQPEAIPEKRTRRKIKPSQIGFAATPEKKRTPAEHIYAGLMAEAPDPYLSNLPPELSRRDKPLDTAMLIKTPPQNYVIDDNTERLLHTISATLQYSEINGDPAARSFTVAGPPGVGKNYAFEVLAASMQWKDEAGAVRQGVPYYNLTVTPDMIMARAIGDIMVKDGTTYLALGPIAQVAAMGGVICIDEIARNPKLSSALQDMMEKRVIRVGAGEEAYEIPVHPSTVFAMTLNPGMEGDADRPGGAALTRTVSMVLPPAPVDQQVDRLLGRFDVSDKKAAPPSVKRNQSILATDYRVPRDRATVKPTRREAQSVVKFFDDVEKRIAGTGGFNRQLQLKARGGQPVLPGDRGRHLFAVVGKTTGDWTMALDTLKLYCDQDDRFEAQWKTVTDIFTQHAAGLARA